jgi:capsular polysaccharide biosynthesis protein
MELNEAGRRILLQHWRLIALVLVACVGGATLIHHGDVTTYTASTRLVLDTQDPQSSTGSTVIGDTARAIATSPYEIQQALDRTGIRDRSPVDVAKHVSASPLGTSGVLQLSVSDRSPVVAQKLANALAASVIRTRDSVNGKRIRQISNDLDGRINELNRQITNADSKVDALNQQLATATGIVAARLRSEIDATSRVRDFASQQRGVLVSERLGLLSTEALRPQASIISASTRPTKPDPSRAVPDLMLGVLLGLVLGVGAAAVLETVRPRLQGGDVLARELRTSHLGTLPAGAGEGGLTWSAEPLSLVLRLAAKGAGVRHVSLLAAEPFPELGVIAKHVEAAANRAGDIGAPAPEPIPTAQVGGHVAPPSLEAMARRAVKAPRVYVRPFGIDFPTASNGAGTGIAVVAPRSLRRSQIVELNHLLSIMPAPVLGLITYSPGRRWPWRTPRSGGDPWTAQLS